MKRIAPAAIGCRRFLFLLLLVTGCAGGPPARDFSSLPPGLPEEIGGVPFHPQQALQCGPAALATVLGWSGVEVAPETLEPLLFLPERDGTLQAEIKAQARRHGRIPYEIPPEPDALLAELAAGHPVLVLQNNGLSWAPAWHYAVVVGADRHTGTIRLRSGTHEDYDLARETFLKTWRRANYWGLVVLPPAEMPATLEAAPVLAAITAFARVAEPSRVETALRAGVERWPEDSGLRFALANHWYAQGRHGEAEAAYRQILAADAEAVMARNNLAWLLAEQGRADEALALLPDDPARTARALPQDPWAKTLAHTARFARCRHEGGTVAQCEAAANRAD